MAIVLASGGGYGYRWPHQARTKGVAGESVSPPKPKLLDRVRDAVRARHYSRRTEKAYVHWIKRYMIYTHVLNRGPAAVRSLADRMFRA